ncbi:MAG: acyltransferase family protein [Methanoregula sp.]|nr:acyltransferase family protein [Methanoregula sp.]
MVRLHYIDNLRWMTILLLFPFHAAAIFCAEWYGYYVSSGDSSTAAHLLLVTTEPWIMPLLFCIAGLSTRYALHKRSPHAYLKERVRKLLIPFLAGLVLICPVIAYYALKFHTGYTGSFAGAFVHFFTSVQYSPGINGIMGNFSVDHLWFIAFLFIFSVAAIGLILLGRQLPHVRFSPGNVPLPVICLLFIPLWLLNLVGYHVTRYSILTYFAMFLIGYYLLACDPVQAKLEKYWAVLLAAWVVLAIGVTWTYGLFMGHGEVFWGYSPLFVLTGWIAVLAFMGTGRHLLDHSNAFATYMNSASYPVYIIHQPVMVAIAYYVLMLAIPQALQYAVIVIGSILLTFACYEILRRIPGVRALFGIIEPEKNAA